MVSLINPSLLRDFRPMLKTAVMQAGRLAKKGLNLNGLDRFNVHPKDNQSQAKIRIVHLCNRVYEENVIIQRLTEIREISLVNSPIS